jgi:hypothetical protein
MSKFEEHEITSFFSILNENNIEYILLRNIDSELPRNLSKKKDIDIIVKIEDKHKLEKAFLKKKCAAFTGSFQTYRGNPIGNKQETKPYFY